MAPPPLPPTTRWTMIPRQMKTVPPHLPLPLTPRPLGDILSVYTGYMHLALQVSEDLCFTFDGNGGGTIFMHGFPEYMSDILIPSVYNGPGEQGNLGAFTEDLEYYPPNIPHGALEFPIRGIDQLSDPTISFNYEVINPNDYLNMSDGANFNTANFDIGMAHFSDLLSTNYSHFPDFDQYSFNSTGGLEILVFHSADLHDQYHDDLPVLPMPQSSPITTTVQEEPIQHQAAAKKRGREEVDKANIVQGRRQKTQSRQARVEA
ncbi:hypothetical protein B0H10DRAFT_1944883 [Mycena sp. CBHHK59/15]|nr:hypothetical protein B0H10DRAFT_1944883 [Mycena sp. CBHHK59/15]